MSNITSAQIGSAVRWIITSGATLFAGQAWASGADWQAIASGAAAAAMLVWSMFSNVKKVG
jgi:hypothetical protein